MDLPGVLVMSMPPVAEACSTLMTDAALCGCSSRCGSLNSIHPWLQLQSVRQRVPSVEGQMLTGMRCVTAKLLAIARCVVSKCIVVVARCHSIRLLKLGIPMAAPIPMIAITMSNWVAVYPLALEWPAASIAFVVELEQTVSTLVACRVTLPPPVWLSGF